MSRYFIYGSFPSLEFGVRPDITSNELFLLFEYNFSKNEKRKVSVLKMWIDISNIYTILNDSKFDPRGNYSKSTIKAFLANQEELPNYVLDFFAKYEKDSDRVKFFPFLIAAFFKEEKEHNSGFIRDFLKFEHDIRLVLAGFRAKTLHTDLAKELQFEDLDNPIVATVLMQKDKGGTFQFPIDYEDLEKVLKEAGSNPTKQYEAIARYKFDFYIKYLGNYTFSLEGILAYMSALWILEDYFALEHGEGESFLENMVERGNVS